MNFLTKEQFSQMWEMQDKLNSMTTGPEWFKNNQNWNLAIKAEVMEFFDYVGWKWWKEPDKTKSCKDMQARLELVDIWHFLLSSIIQNARHLGVTSSDTPFRDMEHTLNVRNFIPGTGAIQDIELLDHTRISNYEKVCLMQYALDCCDWTWTDLYIAYIGKNVLNTFRQENGYKEGHYHKEWFGQEDNVHLEAQTALLVTEGIFSPEELKAQLQDLYDSYLAALK